MAEKLATEVAAGSMATAAVSIATSVVQEANNNLKLQLQGDRHVAKSNYTQRKNSKQAILDAFQRKYNRIQTKINSLTNQIQDEEKKMATFENVNNDANVKFIVGLGMTGDGKSTVLNRLCGDVSKYGNAGPFEAKSSDQSGYLSNTFFTFLCNLCLI